MHVVPGGQTDRLEEIRVPSRSAALGCCAVVQKLSFQVELIAGTATTIAITMIATATVNTGRLNVVNWERLGP